MHDDPNKKTDIFDFTEIEKIQAEIARDLELADSIQLPTAPLPQTVWRVPAPPIPHTPPRQRNKIPWIKRFVTVCIICTLGTATFGFAFGAAYVWMTQRSQGSIRQPASVEPSDSPITTARYAFDIVPEGTVATLADMIDLVSPSVVSVTTFTDPETFRGGSPLPSRRNGTGVIFGEDDERILIVTIHNVVRRGDRVFVRFSCGTSVLAHPFAHDIDINIAVIAVKKTDLAEQGIETVVLASFGDSSLMRMGETVVALGNARGEGISVTRGIISTEEQFVQIPGSGGRTLDVYLIQTDASINYGDSGGPLLNARGEVIGIIDASLTFVDPNASVEGIGHSISANTVRPLLYQLINRLRPAIGIEGRSLSDFPERAVELGIPDIGVHVERVMSGGAADQAGIRAYDVITAFNGEPVLDFDSLRAEITRLRPGDVVEVRVLRDGAVVELELTLQAMVFDTF
ncbi:MAG: S1C family serine protease [Defluviitaleaceae bacterium]|nr:S1C family serine protease [Defluviitaleaceae bacterium]